MYNNNVVKDKHWGLLQYMNNEKHVYSQSLY